MTTEQQRLRAAVFAMTEDQVRASWVREQEWNRSHGLPYYTVLSEQRSRDPRTRRVVARVSA